MKLIISLISFLFVVASHAQDTASVLFIGNSYTYANNLPGLTNSVARSFGDSVEFYSQTLGGYTFQSHANNTDTYVRINSKKWDYVVLQAQSQEPSFPESQVNSSTLPYAMQMADSVYANNFCSEVLMFMTWGRENGDPQWEPISTFEGMNTRLRDAYVRMADSVQGSVSAVGSAWRYVRENYPTIQLYTGDGSHPSYAGSYLAACTFYASIFRKSPIGASFIGTLDQTTADNLQYAASISVLDSLDTWNLRPITEHTQADYEFVVNGASVDFSNNSTKATNYYWDFGDLATSTDHNPTHVFSGNGMYTVQLVAESPCDQDTIQFTVEITAVGLNENSSGAIEVVSKGEGVFILRGMDMSSDIEVYDVEGRVITTLKSESSNAEIDLSAQPKGIYILKTVFNGQEVNIRLPHF